MVKSALGPLTLGLLSTCAALMPFESSWSHESGSEKQSLTVAAALQSRRVLHAHDQEQVSISPDGSRYVIRLARDDLDRGGTVVEIFSGRTNTLTAAAPAKVAELFTTAKADELNTGRHPPTHPGVSRVTWLDNETLAMLWNDGTSSTQVLTVNLRAREPKYVTVHDSSISDFAMDALSGRIVYLTNSAQSQARKEYLSSMLRDGFAVSTTSAFDVLTGNYDGNAPWYQKEVYVGAAGASSRRVTCREIRCGWIRARPESFSPDGRYAIILRAVPASHPVEWDAYRDADLQRSLARVREWPEVFEESFGVAQIALIDLDAAELRPLWSAPFYGWKSPALVWSPDSRRVIVGPTFLPLDCADEHGLTGTAFAELDIASGSVSMLPVPDESRQAFRPQRWNEEGTVQLSDGTTSLYFRKEGDRWQRAAASAASKPAVPRAAVRIELRQDLNTPPALYARDVRTGRERLILDVEPRLRTHYTLGRVENVTWRDAAGEQWHGRMHYPVSQAGGRRFPLVIQLIHEEPSTQFSLLGAGLSDAMGTAYAAQPMANRDIAVLSLYEPDQGTHSSEQHEAELIRKAVEGAVDHFAKSGLTSPEKVGLIGYSRTGWYVEHILAHSEYPFGAAIAADNFDSSYVQSVLGWGLAGDSARNNGGPGYGEGLKAWIERAPGFNAYKIRTPLRLEVGTGGLSSLLGGWEMFSQLHHLRRPVELVIVPESEGASHPLQMPRQKKFSQEGTVDWMDFWLNGREDADPSKEEQYARWRQQRELQHKSSAAMKVSQAVRDARF